jgi:hypothetical protein
VLRDDQGWPNAKGGRNAVAEPSCKLPDVTGPESVFMVGLVTTTDKRRWWIGQTLHQTRSAAARRIVQVRRRTRHRGGMPGRFTDGLAVQVPPVGGLPWHRALFPPQVPHCNASHLAKPQPLPPGQGVLPLAGPVFGARPPVG